MKIFYVFFNLPGHYFLSASHFIEYFHTKEALAFLRKCVNDRTCTLGYKNVIFRSVDHSEVKCNWSMGHWVHIKRVDCHFTEWECFAFIPFSKFIAYSEINLLTVYDIIWLLWCMFYFYGTRFCNGSENVKRNYCPTRKYDKIALLMISAVQLKYYKPIKKGTFVNESLPF